MPGGSRHLSRRAAVQALYQWDLTGQNRFDIAAHFLSDQQLERSDQAYFEETIREVPRLKDELDAQLGPCLDRDLDAVDPVERAILRLATFELLHHPEIPYRVVINEAVELAKTFGSANSYRFVNGILDKLVTTARSVEVGASRG